MTLRPDCYEWIRRTYGVPATTGQRVTVDGKSGIICRKASPQSYIWVRFDGGQRTPKPCHPTWRVSYYGSDGQVLAQYGD